MRIEISLTDVCLLVAVYQAIMLEPLDRKRQSSLGVSVYVYLGTVGINAPILFLQHHVGCGRTVGVTDNYFLVYGCVSNVGNHLNVSTAEFIQIVAKRLHGFFGITACTAWINHAVIVHINTLDLILGKSIADSKGYHHNDGKNERE